jgi:hypothetical protein
VARQRLRDADLEVCRAKFAALALMRPDPYVRMDDPVKIREAMGS